MWRAWTLFVWLTLSLAGVGSALPAGAAEPAPWANSWAPLGDCAGGESVAPASGPVEAATAEAAWAPPSALRPSARRPREGWAPNPHDAGPKQPVLDGPLRPPKQRG